MMSIIRYPLYFLEPLIALSEDVESVSNFFISESFNFTKVIIILINKNKKSEKRVSSGGNWTKFWTFTLHIKDRNNVV